ncbi:GNAT family N-acetyltransferase [Streptomyces sp. NBC_01304]|uniref:GNAT family N-acetyltransferase n=1 Tax=Streptomyces sp. NBC_01304 TaxID=2903818 RepID=UPI002E154252|nr:GNAT family N-acetyltransferase [Streptomyces sp. NBC_01304]
MSSWTVAPEPFDSPDAAALWRAYYTEVSDRWYELNHGHKTDPEELEREIAAESGAELDPPKGALVVARHDGVLAGCAGLRMLDATTGELTRVFVLEDMRGKGGSGVLLRAIEDAARGLGAERLVLDTRLDLVEARALYARSGYAEIEAYNDSMYAEVWFEKHLEAA